MSGLQFGQGRLVFRLRLHIGCLLTGQFRFQGIPCLCGLRLGCGQAGRQLRACCLRIRPDRASSASSADTL